MTSRTRLILVTFAYAGCVQPRHAPETSQPADDCDWRETRSLGYTVEGYSGSIFAGLEEGWMGTEWSELVDVSQCREDRRNRCRVPVGKGREVVVEEDGGYVLAGLSGSVDERGFIDEEGRRTGEWTQFSRGRVEMRAEFRAGLLHGKWTHWDYLAGEIMTGNLENGERNGQWEWRALGSGQVTMRGQYVGGVPDGTWEAWLPDGTPAGSFTLRDGTGDVFYWWPSGRLFEMERAEGGQVLSRTFFDEPGRGWQVMAVHQGEPHGPWARFDGRGTLIESGFHNKGIVLGIHTFYEGGVPVRSVCERGD